MEINGTTYNCGPFDTYEEARELHYKIMKSSKYKVVHQDDETFEQTIHFDDKLIKINIDRLFDEEDFVKTLKI